MPAQTVIQVRRDSAADWTTANSVLSAGEHGFETDTGKFKIGDGSTTWTSLAYAKSGAAPELHATSHEVGGADELELAPAQITGTAVVDSDARLTDARTPTAHASTHATGGSDAITVAQSQVTDLTTDLGNKAPTADPTFTGFVTGNPAAPTNAHTAKAIGYVGLPQVLLVSGGLTLSATHAGDHIYVTGTGQTITIPANASVPLEIGTTIVIINAAGVTTSIAITNNTLLLAGAGTTGTRTLAPHGMATCVKITATSWIISGNGLT